ncbi:MAG: 4-hydroxy-3-methylbut-2-enyl diphosphate reductase [Firmicutes bacterium]|nr:4-hydroxy-3-methylbut-2-enyl diphosphate reductase [Bacillota bacterium]
MEVIVAPRAGFCFGVKRAVEMATAIAARADRPVYTFGPLIHNPVVVRSLAVQGVGVVERPEEARGGTLIIRSHGVPPGFVAEARRLGVAVVDASCPFVRRAQELAARLARDGYQVVLVGDPSHPEVKAVAAAAGGALVVREAAEVDPRRLRSRVGLLCQTTLAAEVLAEVVAVVAPRCRELLVHNTICTATAQRQKAALALAREVEAMVVVGGHASANTRHLAELCRRIVPTYQVEGPEELRPEWVAGCARIGLTAGASTPAEQIEAVKRRLEEMSQEGK